ncbi:unnamed protein product [Ixodes hexagonus]
MMLNRSGRCQPPQPPPVEATVPAVNCEAEPGTATQCDDTELGGDHGPLRLLLSATDRHDGSTQVTHAEQVDEVTTTEGAWRRQCGFLGLESLKSSQHALQDLCGVTLTVFSLLLSFTPATRYGKSDMPAEYRLTLFLMKLKLGIHCSGRSLFCTQVDSRSNLQVLVGHLKCEAGAMGICASPRCHQGVATTFL